MTTLIIIRHGETEANLRQVWQGSLDAPLTKRGERQAQAAAQGVHKLAVDLPIDRFYVSPLGRTQSTAAPIAEAIGIQPVLEDGLREFDLGDWEGRSFQELRDDEHLWERWDQDPTFAPPNGESPAMVSRRAVEVFESLADRHPAETVMAVTHGGVICNVLATFLGEGPQDWQKWHPHNCAISVLQRTDDGWTSLQVNDISHLPPDALKPEDNADYIIKENSSKGHG